MTVKDFPQMEELENELFARLKPVKPRSEFVDHLKFRLDNPPTTVIEPPSWKTGALILAFGITGGFLFYAIIRKLVRWFGQ